MSTYISYSALGSGSAQIVTYSTFASFPASAPEGSFALALDTDTLYVFDAGTNAWVSIAQPGGGGVTSLGTFDSQVPTVDGAVISGTTLYMQAATATEPGLVNNTTQSFSGNKTFTGTISASNLSGTNTGDVTLSTANGLSLVGQALSLALSSGSTTGALSNTDWTTFNNKQAAGSYITALTGDVTASGPGSVAATIANDAVTTVKILDLNVTTGKLADNAVSNAKFRQSAALSVVGVTGNATSNVADIAGTANQVLRINSAGTALAFGQLNLASSDAVTGTLAVANGGTNSTTSLNNNRVMQSSAGAIVEAAAITANRALISDANGIPTHSATTATELGYVSGATSSIQNQINAISSGASAPLSANNYELAMSVGSSALTIALKDSAGNDPSAGSPVQLAFRSTTASDGTYEIVTATAATSIVISSGSTLGHTSNKLEPIYVYAINNAGTIVLGVSSKLFTQMYVASTTAEGGSGGADSATIMYSTAAQTSKAIRLIGVLLSNQATAGTWAAVPTVASLQRNPFYTLGSVQTFAADGTWTRPNGCLAVRVTVQASGGGGGGADGGAGTAGNCSAGGGGGGGGAAIKFITLGLGTTETVTVGTGGTAGTASGGGNGGDGNPSSFGSLVSATGGTGGAGRATITSTIAVLGQGGAGGTGSGGDINLQGQEGFNGIGFGSSCWSGNGGPAATGSGGGRGTTGNAAGGNGIYGSGGAGGGTAASSTDRAGGTGGNGFVVVEEYY